MKSAFYGGSFDPIHVVHEEMIVELSQRFDIVYCIVSYNWTKNNALYSYKLRHEALKEVCKPYPNIIVLDWGFNIDTSSTYLMVKKIKEEFNTTPYIAIGSDNSYSIDQWKNWDLLKDEFPFVVFQRDNNVVSDKVPNPMIINLNSKNVGVSSTKIRNDGCVEMIPSNVRSMFRNIKND